jgi:hypothetical protein
VPLFETLRERLRSATRQRVEGRGQEVAIGVFSHLAFVIQSNPKGYYH